MFRLFNEPYPIDEPARQSWLRAALIGLFVGLFLLAFQPFGTDQWQTPHKTVKLLGFGIISFVITALNFLVWPRLFPHLFREESWTVGKAILFITANILLIALANRLYLAWLLGTEVHNLLSMVLITFLVGVFPTAGAVIASYIVKLRRYARQATDLRISANSPISPPTLTARHAPSSIRNGPSSVVADEHNIALSLTLVADNEREQIILAPADLFYVESSDNYCTIVYLKNGQPIKPLLRSSLGRLEGQINQPHIVRCHRSYLVNLNRVERVTGNAQGYKLHLLGGQFQIPVARKYNDTLVAELKAL